jgi:hypothetical protein
MNLLYPDFIASPRGPETRTRVIRALQAHDAVAARREIENDIRRALSYVANLADEDGNIAPAEDGKGRIRRTSWPSSSAINASPGSTASSCRKARS